MEAWRRSSKESVKRMLDYCLLMEAAKIAKARVPEALREEPSRNGPGFRADGFCWQGLFKHWGTGRAVHDHAPGALTTRPAPPSATSAPLRETRPAPRQVFAVRPSRPFVSE
jgi:hypothetical protein